MRYLAGVTVAALAAMLVLFASGNSVTEASVYTPASTASVADSTPHAISDVTVSATFPSGGAMVKGFEYFSFLPEEWNVVGTDASIPDGSIAGVTDAFANLGAFNTFCGLVQVPVAGLPLMEATTGTWSSPTTITSPTVIFEDNDGDGVGEIFDDPVSNTRPLSNHVLAVRRGTTEYPAYIAALYPEPILRYWGYLDVAGSDIAINWVIWDKGALSSMGITADKGYPMQVFLNRTGDPLDPGNPLSPLTDFCSSWTSKVTMLGTTTPNPLPQESGPTFVGAFVDQMRNPTSGEYDFRDFSRSQRDADNDGIENGLDTCPVSFNSDASPRTPGAPLPLPELIAAGPPAVPSTADPDGWIDLGPILGLPAFINPPGSNPGPPTYPVGDVSAPEGIDSSCDAGPASPCGPSFADDFFAQDCDLDGWLNRGDNCPQAANPAQTDADGTVGSFAPDLGPIDDDIGDACDPNPASVDGHYHMSTDPQGSAGPICVTSPIDSCGPIDSTGNSPAVVPSIPASIAALLPAPAGGPIILPDDAFSRVTVTIGKHGVKLNTIGGPKNVKAGTTKSYSVDVSNFSETESQDIVVLLSVASSCGGSILIDGGAGPVETTVADVAPDGSATVSFSVEYGTCTDASGSPDYILTADACHQGDPAGKGFGLDPCPGGDDGHNTEDPNQADDAPISKNINEK